MEIWNIIHTFASDSKMNHRQGGFLGSLFFFKIMALRNIKEIERNQKHSYMMLGRMESDCKFYLGAGSRDAHYSLYMLDEKAQISEMLHIYKRLTLKPVWIDVKTILWYADQMGVRVERQSLLLAKDFILRTCQRILYRKAFRAE